MMENYKTWYGVELDEDTAEIFRHCLRESVELGMSLVLRGT